MDRWKHDTFRVYDRIWLGVKRLIVWLCILMMSHLSCYDVGYYDDVCYIHWGS